MNFKDKFLEIKKLYKIWLKRQITPLGRIAVLKSLVLSKITHLWLLLPNPPDNYIDELQKSVYYFVWNKKRDKINRKTAATNLTAGGIGIPDVRRQIQALKVTWIKRLMVSNHKWKHFTFQLFPTLFVFEKIGTAFVCSSLSTFWKDVFQAYSTLSCTVKVETLREFCSEPIFCNDNIHIPFQRKNVYSERKSKHTKYQTE